MTKQFEVTDAFRLDSIAKAIKSDPPGLHFTRGMAKAAREIDADVADRRLGRVNKKYVDRRKGRVHAR